MRWLLLIGLISLIGGCASNPAASRDASVDRFLRETPPEMIVEIDYVEGFEPTDPAVDALTSTLDGVSDKQTIGVERSVIPRRASIVTEHEWTLDELTDLAETVLDERSSDVVVLHVLYLDGRIEGEPDTAGIAIGRTAFLFVPHNDLLKVGLGRAEWERALLVHEVGHVIGLVDLGAPMVRPHAKSDDPHHSANPESVMWPTISSYDAALSRVRLGEPPPWRYDSDDLADLAAVRVAGR